MVSCTTRRRIEIETDARFDVEYLQLSRLKPSKVIMYIYMCLLNHINNTFHIEISPTNVTAVDCSSNSNQTISNVQKTLHSTPCGDTYTPST